LWEPNLSYPDISTTHLLDLNPPPAQPERGMERARASTGLAGRRHGALTHHGGNWNFPATKLVDEYYDKTFQDPPKKPAQCCGSFSGFDGK
jgi:hypothetical protein